MHPLFYYIRASRKRNEKKVDLVRVNSCLGGRGVEESVGVSGKSAWKMLAGGNRHMKNNKKWNLLMLQKF
jgi:hypothetical protein